METFYKRGNRLLSIILFVITMLGSIEFNYTISNADEGLFPIDGIQEDYFKNLDEFESSGIAGVVGDKDSNESVDFRDTNAIMTQHVPYIKIIGTPVTDKFKAAKTPELYIFPSYNGSVGADIIATENTTTLSNNIRLVLGERVSTINDDGKSTYLKGTKLLPLKDTKDIEELKMFNNGVNINNKYKLIGGSVGNNTKYVGVSARGPWLNALRNDKNLMMGPRQLELFIEVLNGTNSELPIVLKAEASSNGVGVLNTNLVGKFGKYTIDSKRNLTINGNDSVTIPIDLSKVKFNLTVNGNMASVDSTILRAIADYKGGDDSLKVINKVIEEALSNYVTKAVDDAKNTGNQSNVSVDSDVVKGAISDLENGKGALGAWMILVNNFFATGDTTIEESNKNVLGIEDGETYNALKVMDLKDYGYRFILDEFRNGSTSKGDALDGDLTGIITKLGSNAGNKIKNYTMTPYDDFRLRVYFNILAQYKYIDDPSVSTKVRNQLAESGKYNLSEKFAINKSFSSIDGELGSLNYFYPDMKASDTSIDVPDMTKDQSGGMTLMSQADQAAKSEFKAIEENSSPNSTLLAKNFEAVSKYILFGVVSSDAGTSYSTDSSNTLKIEYNEKAMSIIPSLNLDSSDGSGIVSSDATKQIMYSQIDYTKFGLPDLKNVTRIVNNEFSRNKASQLYVSLMFIKQYASLHKEDSGNGIFKVTNDVSDTSGLSLKGNKEFDDYKKLTYKEICNTNIDNLIKSTETMSDEDKKKFNIDTTTGSQIRQYIQIHDGMDYIGLSPDDKWVSPELRCVYEYYNSISVWKDAVSTDKYNQDDLKATQPFSEFFSLKKDASGKNMFGDYVNKGVAASATYLPLVTNLYDYTSVDVIGDNDFINNFHYKYGFHRKALFIDTNQNAALQSYVTGQRDSLKVATLKDMLQPEKDIVLYTDSNFYNIKQLAEKQDLSYSKIQNTKEAGKSSDDLISGMADMWSEWRNLDASSICKTAGQNLYSSALAKQGVLKSYGEDRGNNAFWDSLNKNHYVLSSDAIDEYYASDDYSDTQAFAFVSGVYRCPELLTICQNQSSNPKPVFVSSPTLPFVNGVSKKEFNSIYNYLMVKNLKINMGLDYKTELDLDSPLFLDVYGNISTQSGTVVIPAASNATLYEPDKYSIITAGLASLTNNVNSWRIPDGKNNVKEMLDSGFELDEETKTYRMVNKETADGVSLNFNNLPLQASGVKTALYNDAYANCSGGINGGTTFDARVNNIIEVMRGAPIENINFEEEGLSGNRSVDQTGVYIAYRIEQLSDLLLSNSNGNSLLNIPNIAFMPGIEYLVVAVFQVLIAIGLFVLVIKIYIDGNTNNLGLRTLYGFTFSMASVIIGLVAIPTLVNFSYYQTNKRLLQDESAYLLVLNTEKNSEGKEVGIKEVRVPESSSKFYLKLNEVKVPWWTVLQNIYSENMFKSMSEVYEKAFDESIYTTFDGVEKRGNGLYMSVENLFKTSEVRFEEYEKDKSDKSEDQTGFLYQAVSKDNKMSYVIPYYAILDKLLFDVQSYNKVYKSSAFRTKIMQNGNVRTIGLLESYFTSNQFLSDSEHNLFGLYDIYDIPYSTDLRQNIYSEEEIGSMSKSLWYNKESFTDEEVEEKLKELDEKGKKFIIDNRSLLNKVTDETFIKVFALYMSTEHNKLFEVPAANGVELSDIDTKDIIRLSLAPKSSVMHSISMSFGRFTYNQAGTFGTILMAFLIVIYYFTSLIRPILQIILVAGLIISYVYKKVLRKDENHALQGYLVSCALILIVNVIYAIFLKLSVSLSSIGIDVIKSIIVQIVLQCVYAVILSVIGYIVLGNMDELGYYKYRQFYDTHMSNKITALTLSVDNVMSRSIMAPLFDNVRHSHNNIVSNRSTKGVTGNDFIERIRENDRRRREDISNNR